MKFMKKFVPVFVLISIFTFLFVSADGQERGSSASTWRSTLSANDRLPAIVKYPLQTNAKLTWWVTLSNLVSVSYASLNDSPFAQGLIERTGVQIEYIHPAQNMETEHFNLLIATGRMPDIVEFNWLSGYNGGMDTAIRNQLVFPLNNVINTWAADFKKYLDDYSNLNLDKMVKTDEGNYYGFPMTNVDNEVLTSSGPIIRQDWLDDLGLQRPETIDELTEVLRAFKDRKGASVPMALYGGNALVNIFFNGAITGAYHTFYDMYVDNNVIKYGPAQSSYKDAVRQMNQWYREGLLDKNFASNRSAERDANVLNGNTGVTFGYGISGMDILNRAFRDIDPDAYLRSFKYPSLEKGENSWFGHRRNHAVAESISVVNPRSPNTEIAVKTLNYGYTQAGIYYYNFGIEGVSYNMINNFPTMADFILDPVSDTVGQAWARYTRVGPYSAPSQQHVNFMMQYWKTQELREAMSIWPDTEASLHILPPLTVSFEESRTYNRIKSDLDAYVLEWTIKAIADDANIEMYDTVFLRTLHEIGVDEAVAIQNAALARYNRR